MSDGRSNPHGYYEVNTYKLGLCRLFARFEF